MKQPETEGAKVSDGSKVIAPDAAGKALERLGPQENTHTGCYQ